MVTIEDVITEEKMRKPREVGFTKANLPIFLIIAGFVHLWLYRYEKSNDPVVKNKTQKSFFNR